MKSKNEIPAYSRKDFLRTAGSAALFAALGITVTSCGSPTDPNGDNTPGPNPPPGGSGIVIEGNKITINLGVSANAGLKNSGGVVINYAGTNHCSQCGWIPY